VDQMSLSAHQPLDASLFTSVLEGRVKTIDVLR